MTDLRELMHDAAEGAPGPDGLLVKVRSARRRRSRRHVAYGGLAAVAAGAAAVVAVPALLPLQGGPSRSPVAPGAMSSGAAPSATTTVAPSAGATPATVVRCDGFRDVSVPETDVAADVRLTSHAVGATQEGAASGHRQHGECATAPLVLAYEGVAGDQVVRTLHLIGPSSTVPQVGGSPVTLRGTTGQLVRTAAGLLLSWKEREQTWTLSSGGLTEDQLLSVANGLTLAGTVAADPATTDAAGLQPLPVAPQPVDRDVWDVSYQVAGHHVGVNVSNGGQAAGLVEVPATIVDVNGHRGEVSDLGGMRVLVWQPSPGVVAEVSAEGLTVDKLVTFAASLVPAAAGG